MWGLGRDLFASFYACAGICTRESRPTLLSAMARKSVLVSYGENRRVLKVPVDAEREHVLELCRTEFRDLIPQRDNCVLALQKKEEVWGGVFVDYTESAIEDKAIFQLVAAVPVVRILWTCIYSHVATHSCIHVWQGRITQVSTKLCTTLSGASADSPTDNGGLLQPEVSAGQGVPMLARNVCTGEAT